MDDIYTFWKTYSYFSGEANKNIEKLNINYKDNKMFNYIINNHNKFDLNKKSVKQSLFINKNCYHYNAHLYTLQYYMSHLISQKKEFLMFPVHSSKI